MNSYTLFTSTDCHLCDLAKDLLRSVASSEFNLDEINVKQEREYFHQYGARIPVLKNNESDAELGWPFDRESLQEFLK